MNTKFITTLITATAISLSSALWVNGEDATPAASPAKSAMTQACPKHHGHKTPDKILAHMTRRLDLTKAQQDKILPLLESEADTVKTTHKQIFALLTPDQQKKLAEMRHKRWNHNGNKETPATTTVSPSPAG